MFEEISAKAFGGISFGAMGERRRCCRSRRRSRTCRRSSPPTCRSRRRCASHRYRPLFSGAAVERTPELQFQRPAAEIELARADAEARGIGPGDEVVVSSNGTSVTLRARLSRTQPPGIARIAEEHAGALPAGVEVKRA